MASIRALTCHALLRSQLMQLRILPDDIIVSGTDGLFDNVFAEEVASLVTFARKRGRLAGAGQPPCSPATRR